MAESVENRPGADAESAQPTAAVDVTLAEATRTWGRVAALSFGGPAGQIAVMHRIIVDEKQWISEERFLHALNYCMLLPGPEAQQLATYIGWLMHGTRGGLIAGGLFILPGFLAILGLSILYANYRDLMLVQGAFFGLKAAVMAIVAEAVLRIGKRVLKRPFAIALAVIAFAAIFALHIPFPVIIVAAGLLGLIERRFHPGQTPATAAAANTAGIQADNDDIAADSGAANVSGSTREESFASVSRRARWKESHVVRSLLVSLVCLSAWWGPLLILRQLLGSNSVYWQEGLFFSQAAIVTFGGAYAVLAYVAQQAVDHFGWLQPGEMLDGLGMAETTPGPLIIVVQFVGFMGAYRNPGPFSPLAAGVLGSVVTAWVTFVPCFYWIFLGAPYVERLRGNRVLASALSAITAAVVGVILNLAVWFSMHTLFDRVGHWSWSVVEVPWPVWSTLDVAALAIAAVAFGLTFVWKRGMATTLAICAAMGLVVVWLRRWNI